MENSEEEFTFPATTESQSSFFESPPFWPRPASDDRYEERFKYFCSCQECKISNADRNMISFHAATTAETLPSFTEPPQPFSPAKLPSFTEAPQPFSPATGIGNLAGFKEYEYCSCQECRANNFNQNSSSTTTTVSRPSFTESLPPVWRQPFTQIGNSAGFKNIENEEKFISCSCQECKANNLNQNNISRPTTTKSPLSFIDPPPRLRQPFSPVTLLENTRSFNKEEKPNLLNDSNNVKQRKSSSCDDNGQEDDKMDMLWENLNEEISRTSTGKNMPKEIDNPSPGRDVQISCVKALKLSKVNGHTLSRKKASILVFMRVLKRGFAMHRSRRSIKKRAW